MLTNKKSFFDYSAFDSFPETQNIKRSFFDFDDSDYLQKPQTLKLIKSFAKTNNLRFHKSLGIPELGSIPIKRGAAYKLVEGELCGLPFQHAFQATYIASHEKLDGGSEIISYTRVSLPRYLPHIALDTRMDGGFVEPSILSWRFSKKDRIQLEGSFNRYFNLYSAKKYHISTLSILTPDVMELLLKNRTYCDIEIFKNHIYFFWTEPSPAGNLSGEAIHFNKELIKDRLETVGLIVERLKPKLISSDIFAHDDQKYAHEAATLLAKPKTLKSFRPLLANGFSAYMIIVLIYSVALPFLLAGVYIFDAINSSTFFLDYTIFGLLLLVCFWISLFLLSYRSIDIEDRLLDGIGRKPKQYDTIASERINEKKSRVKS